MDNKVKSVPYDHQNIVPYILAENVANLIVFLQHAFGGTLKYKLDRPDGSIMHAEVSIGKNFVMMGEPTEQFGAMPVAIYLYVEDCDKIYNDALSAGAVSVAPVKTMKHAGERYGCVRDPAGNLWWIATHVEDMSLEESERRLANIE